jgi:hypothetical protein
VAEESEAPGITTELAESTNAFQVPTTDVKIQDSNRFLFQRIDKF